MEIWVAVIYWTIYKHTIVLVNYKIRRNKSRGMNFELVVVVVCLTSAVCCDVLHVHKEKRILQLFPSKKTGKG